jgi:aryl-alcohol dehydrogenase-like predicted oxidoreductase
MQFQVLPRTDLRVSNLCLGTASFGADIGESDSLALLDQFFDAGGNFLDTAAIYAAWTAAGKGSSEKLIGKWLRGRKHSAIIGTKGGHPELASMQEGRLSHREVEADLEQSLSNLGVETIDLYYLHRDDPSVPVEEILSFLEDFVAAGKIRYYGFSNWSPLRAQEAHLVAQARRITGFVANQPLWSLAQADTTNLDPTMVAMSADFEKWHLQNQMAVVPYSSQANGYFNKIAENKPLSSSVSSTYDSDHVRSVNRTRGARIQALSHETGFNITQIGLGFLLGQPFPTVPIIGCNSPAQLADSLSAAEVRLTAEQIAQLVE